MKQRQIQPISQSRRTRRQEDDDDGLRPLSAREFVNLPRRQPNGREPESQSNDQNPSDHR